MNQDSINKILFMFLSGSFLLSLGLSSANIFAVYLQEDFKVPGINIANVKLCNDLVDFRCLEDLTNFTPDSGDIYFSAYLQDAQIGNQFSAIWNYLDNDGIEILKEEIQFDEPINAIYGKLDKPQNGWPSGSYEVILEIDGLNAEFISKSFYVQ